MKAVGKIPELTEQKRPFWNSYVQQHACGLPQHLAGWQDVIQNTYGYQTRYLLAEKNEKIVGVLPLFLVDSFILGRTVRTMPGGLVADCNETAVSLLNAGQSWAKEHMAKKFAVADSRQLWQSSQLQIETDHIYWTLPLKSTEDEMWKQLHSNMRRQIKIARRNKLTVTIDKTTEQLSIFYDLFAKFAHQTGTPLFSKRFVEQIVVTFPNCFNIAVVYEEKRPLGAYFQLEMGQTMYGIWGATQREHLKKRPVYLAYWEMMRYAINNGFQILDMGRSPLDSNASHFKSQWGGHSFPIYQLSKQLKMSAAPQKGGQRSSKIDLVRKYWPLLPFPVAHFLGPKLRRHIPFA